MFQLPYEEAVPTLDAWIGWARRCRIPRFVKLQRTIVAHRDTILASIEQPDSHLLLLAARRDGPQTVSRWSAPPDERP